MEFARVEFALLRPGKDGKPCRKKVLFDIYEQTGILADELSSAPTVPPETEYLWRWFQGMSEGRQNGMGYNPLMYGEMEAWLRLNDLRAAPWELRAVRRLDTAWLTAMNSDEVTQVAGSASSIAAAIPRPSNE